MHGDVAVAQMLERENFSGVGRASALEYVPSPTEWSVGSVLFQVLLEQVDWVDVLHAEHSRFTGSSSRGSLFC